MTIKFKNDKKLALKYLMSLSKDTFESRFSIGAPRKQTINDVMKKHTIYICALDETNNVVGLLDGNELKHNGRRETINNKHIVEIGLVVSVPGISKLLFEEFKRQYPKVNTIGHIKADNIKSLRFAQRHLDIVVLGNLYAVAVEVGALGLRGTERMYIKWTASNQNLQCREINELCKTLNQEQLIKFEIMQMTLMLHEIGMPNNIINNIIQGGYSYEQLAA